MPNDHAMNYLLTAVEAAAATTSAAPTNTVNAPQPPAPPAPPPLISPPPPLPPSLPVPPPLPPLIHQSHHSTPLSIPHSHPHPPPHPPTPTTTTITLHETPPPPPGLPPKRKGSRIFTADEKKVLQANYMRNKFPSRLQMQTIARVFGKSPDKVRTWYNNRRALDRKLGIDVLRSAPLNTPQHNSPSSSQSPPTPSPTTPDDHVLLPSRLLANHHFALPYSSAAAANHASVSQSLPDTLVHVSPSAINWAPAVSPVSSHCPSAATPTAASPPTQSPPPSRLRLSPLRIRSGKLYLGNTTLHGHIPEDPHPDQGLEIKFLFGKKRVVYEWYYGPDFANSSTTGGPYAKIEMNFSSLMSIDLHRGPVMSVMELSFSVPPSLYIQTLDSMNKYKLRAQQRQYRKVRRDQFPIPVVNERHRVWMRAEDAMRVSRILIDDCPSLRDSFRIWVLPDHRIAPPPAFDFSAHQGPNMEALRDHAQTSARRMPAVDAAIRLASSADSVHQSMAMDDLTKKTAAASLSNATAPGVMAPPADSSFGQGTRVPTSAGNELPIVRTTTAAGAAANLMASPAPWASPTTPFSSGSRQGADEASMAWLAAATPLGERSNLRRTPQEAARVRRELNFAQIGHPSGDGIGFYTPNRKRKVDDSTEVENEENLATRRRLNGAEGQVGFHQAIRFGAQEGDLGERGEMDEKTEDARDGGPQVNKVSQVEEVDKTDSVLRSLPR